MRTILFSCDCGDTPSFARQAYMDLTGKTAPNVYAGTVGLAKAVSRLPATSMASQYINEYLRVKKPFAFWMEVDEDGDIAKLTNLLTGQEVK